MVFPGGGIGLVIPKLIVNIFRGRNLGAIMGALGTGFAIGAAIGPALGGFIYDVTNSYTMAFLIGAATMLVAALLFALIGRESNITKTSSYPINRIEMS